MTDKRTFGSFIKLKRSEKNYSQKDLAEMLFVTEGAVSKWERGVSYPDITLISDICRVLDISEHELITASTDTDTRKMKHEARKFRVIRDTWFWGRALDLFYLQSCHRPHVVLVFHRIDRTDLRLHFYPHGHILF